MARGPEQAAQPPPRGQRELPAEHAVARVEQPGGAARHDTPARLLEQRRPAVPAEMPEFRDGIADLAVARRKENARGELRLAAALHGPVDHLCGARSRPAPRQPERLRTRL